MHKNKYHQQPESKIMSRLTHAFSRKLRSFSLMSLVFAIAVASYVSLPVAAAACSTGCVASMSASPGSGTYNPGATITVSVRVNSGGQSINAVQSDFTYSSSRLQYVSGSAVGANGWTSYVATVGSGSGSVVVGRTSGATTNGTVISMKFKTLSSAGTGSISFSGSSEVNKADGSGENILGTRTGASYSITIPAPPAPDPDPEPNPDPAPSDNNSPSSPGTSTPSAPSTPDDKPKTNTDQPKTPVDQEPTTQPEAKDTNAEQSTPKKQGIPWSTIGLVAGGVLVVGGAAATWFLRRRGVMPIKSGSVPSSDFITGSPDTMPPVHHDEPRDPFKP